MLVNTFYGDSSLNENLDLFITSVEVFEDSIYFSENTTNTIRKCNKNECKVPEIYRKGTPNVTQIKIMALSDSISDSTDISGCYYHQRGKDRKCDHLCIPKGKSDFICACAIGYKIDRYDPSKCIGSDDLIIYSLGYVLKGIGIEDEDSDTVVHDLGEPLTPLQRLNVISSFDVDSINDFIYMADYERGEILRIKRDGSSRKTILTSSENYDQNNDWLGGIAVDWVAQNIYWTDKKRGLIEVSRLDGSFRRVILSQLFKPSLIAVDPLLGLLFYVTGENKIIRLNMDGSTDLNGTFYVTRNSGNAINDFTLDAPNQAIYVCETKKNKIWKIEYDGNGRKDLEIANVTTPTSVDVNEGRLYWSERTTGSIKSIRLEGLNDLQVVTSSLGNQLQSIRIFSTHKQHGSNLCAMPSYGGCEELCLFNGLKSNCFCSHGYLDPKNRTNCLTFDNFLFFSRMDSIEKLQVNAANGSIINTTIQNQHDLQNVVALSYDFDSQIIYYSDLRLNAIYSCTFEGKNFTKLIDKQHSVEGIAFNAQDNRLYWTLNTDAEIRTIDMRLFRNGTIVNENIEKSIQTILKLKKGIDKLRAIVVEPCLSMLYFSNWNSRDPAISRIYSTGYGRENLITRDIFMPNALTLDLSDKKIFWADARLDKIERCDYDGRNRVILAQSAPKHPFSIGVFGDFIYWTDWLLHGVIRANKYSGNDVSFLKNDVEKPMGLFIAHESMKNCTNAACASFNGGCEDTCLPHGDSFTCACTQGYLDKDGKRCLNRNREAACNRVSEFECRSGECVPYIVTCDGIPHCSDNSDEAINFCAARKCPEEMFFQCRNFRCIFKNETCNGRPDCEDGSDEENCFCTKDQFKCSSGECIQSKHRCDNDPDCKDASDEMGCEVRDCSSVLMEFSDTKTISEGRKLIPCPNTTACYMKDWECDGK
jgi:low-density lipoprotein receptor-related protein 1 (alpha-2-macroglobulin receptor)